MLCVEFRLICRLKVLFYLFIDLKVSDHQKEDLKKNIAGKEENAGNQHFLLFTQRFFFFFPIWRTNSISFI